MEVMAAWRMCMGGFLRKKKDFSRKNRWPSLAL